MPFGFGGKKEIATGQGSTSDEIREQRLEAVRVLCGQFLVDLAKLVSGNQPSFDYLAPGIAQRLQASIEPFLATGDAMRPNFGPFANLRIDGDLINRVHPVSVKIEFEDQSIRETAQRDLLPAKRRRIEATLLIDPDLKHVREVSIFPAAEPKA